MRTLLIALLFSQAVLAVLIIQRTEPSAVAERPCHVRTAAGRSDACPAGRSASVPTEDRDAMVIMSARRADAGKEARQAREVRTRAAEMVAHAVFYGPSDAVVLHTQGYRLLAAMDADYAQRHRRDWTGQILSDLNGGEARMVGVTDQNYACRILSAAGKVRDAGTCNDDLESGHATETLRVLVEAERMSARYCAESVLRENRALLQAATDALTDTDGILPTLDEDEAYSLFGKYPPQPPRAEIDLPRFCQNIVPRSP